MASCNFLREDHNLLFFSLTVYGGNKAKQHTAHEDHHNIPNVCDSELTTV